VVAGIKCKKGRQGVLEPTFQGNETRCRTAHKWGYADRLKNVYANLH